MQPGNEQDGIGDISYYEKWYGDRKPQVYSRVLSEIIRHGRPGTLVDIGCGTGLLLELARNWGISASGCDGAQAAVDATIGKLPRALIRRCSFSEGLPFPDGSFDNALLNQVVEHLPPEILTRVLLESRRILVDGGVLFVFSPSKCNKKEVEKDPTHQNPLFPSELRTLLTLAGFTVFREPNQLMPFFRRPLLGKIGSCLLKTRLRDRLSATANAYAKR